MLNLENNNFNEEAFEQSEAAAESVSAPSSELGNMASVQRSLGNYARQATQAVLAIIDLTNPLEIIAKSKNAANENVDQDEPAGKKDDKPPEEPAIKGASINPAEAAHNEETRNILVNADTIISKSYRSLDDSGQKVSPKKESSPPKENSTGQRLSPTPVPAEQAAKAKAAQLVQADLERKAAEAALKAEATRLAQARGAELNLQLLQATADKKEALKPIEATTLEEVTAARDLAKELNLPLVVDFYAPWCHFCTEMDDEALSYLEGKSVASNKPKVEAVYVHVNGDEVAGGIRQITGPMKMSNQGGYPYVVVYNQNDYERPAYAQSGKLFYNVLAGLINGK